MPAEAVLDAAGAVDAIVDAEAGTELAGLEAAGADEAGAAEPPGGCVVGTVEGWSAVFQVAVVGHAVAATAGEVVP